MKSKREIAYHEAGHAAITWLFGKFSDLQFIDMQGSDEALAFVNTRADLMAIVEQHPEQYRNASAEMQRVIRLQSKMRMMFNLAGFAAENRVQPPESGWHWLEELMADDCWVLCEGHDLLCATRLARAIHGPNGNAIRFLKRMATWTDEAFAEPRLAAAVDALADRLVRVKTRLDGPAAVRTMDRAWGNPTALPYLELGRKWRRRFAFSL